MRYLTIDTTVLKSFTSLSDLMTKTANHKIYIELSNKYFIAVSKSDIKKVAKTMNENNEKFSGLITFITGQKVVQVKIDNN